MNEYTCAPFLSLRAAFSGPISARIECYRKSGFIPILDEEDDRVRCIVNGEKVKKVWDLMLPTG